ncbi:hypothetical protein C8R45DRAFT_1183566 [Mycena sanguinolenta]|nr:hypothetical protein C8R45DRAFT_1183566 [Mycena sanguinolenta]
MATIPFDTVRPVSSRISRTHARVHVSFVPRFLSYPDPEMLRVRIASWSRLGSTFISFRQAHTRCSDSFYATLVLLIPALPSFGHHNHNNRQERALEIRCNYAQSQTDSTHGVASAYAPAPSRVRDVTAAVHTRAVGARPAPMLAATIFPHFPHLPASRFF